MLQTAVVIVSLALSAAAFAAFVCLVWLKASLTKEMKAGVAAPARDAAQIEDLANAIGKVADAFGKLPAEIAALVASMVYLAAAVIVIFQTPG